MSEKISLDSSGIIFNVYPRLCEYVCICTKFDCNWKSH